MVLSMDRRILIALTLAPMVTTAACERRVAEPIPARSAATSAPPAGSVSAEPTAAPDPLAGRCIKPLPPEPEREVPPGPDPTCPQDPGRPTLPTGKVVFDGAGATVAVEVAKDPEHRQRGLMYRKELPEDEGMIFLFERRRLLTFWMKNTCLPLDMIFIDHDGVVVGIQENVPTMNRNTYHVGCPSQYVLEVNAGWSRKHGVKPGQKARFVGFEG
jgi:uncharacterized membrane protein (UPF0127 family)